MRLAAFYAGLTLNALFFGYAADLARGRGDTVALVAAPLVWGMFLLFGAYWVPARTGLGPRELVEAQLGRWVGGFVWWVWLPLWAVSWYGDLTSTFLYTVHAPFFRWEEAGRASVDTRIAVAWPWVVLTALGGPAPVRFSQRSCWRFRLRSARSGDGCGRRRQSSYVAAGPGGCRI